MVNTYRKENCMKFFKKLLQKFSKKPELTTEWLKENGWEIVVH